MANSNTYTDGLTSGGSQVTTLSDIQGTGLSLPPSTQTFIDIRSPGKLEQLFNVPGNSRVLYNTNKPQDLYLKGPIASQMFIYTNIEEGQRRDKTVSKFNASLRDGERIRKFLGSNKGILFILRQTYGQGYQPFDETKVYNPASPLIAALRLVSLGAVDYPTRHLDTSNIVGGLLGGTGLGTVARLAGGLFGGGGPPVPAPPRSSVASAASTSNLFSAATFSSFLGGADNSDRVVAPIARPDVKGLLRGQTATNAYNNNRYYRLTSPAGGNSFSKILSAAGTFLKNNTLIGGIIPPKQPWAANYRADEQTYDLYLNAGKLFDDSNVTPTKSGGILSGLKNVLGIGTTRKFTGLRANQRFYHGSVNPSSMLRNDKYIKTYGMENQQDAVGVVVFNGSVGYNQVRAVVNSDFSQPARDRFGNLITANNADNKTSKTARQLNYTDLVKTDRNNGTLEEQSDQLLNYKVLIENSNTLTDTFSDETKLSTKLIIDNLNKAINNIGGTDANDLYDIGFVGRKNVTPMQFAKFSNTNNVGMNYLKELDASNLNSPYAKNDTYQGRFRRDQSTGNNMPTRLGQAANDRFIKPTNNVDYVNSLGVMNQDLFNTQYGNESKYGRFGPDIIKFYFYDIVNEKYIPFSATVKSIIDTNSAQWDPVEYLGRPDKLYYYKGFTREVSFNFAVVAHSIKELRPMWERINYLVGLTRPANYTNGAAGGFMISPMVQLTLGDFFKNHNIVINSCNVSIPDEASWETLPEDMTAPNDMWSWGPNKAYSWSSEKNLVNPRGDKSNSKGQFAQFPRTAEINMSMNILEKDRPKTGRAIWGDAPVPTVTRELIKKLTKEGVIEFDPFAGNDIYNSNLGNDFYGVRAQSLKPQNGILVESSLLNFSKGIRYDTDLENAELTPAQQGLVQSL